MATNLQFIKSASGSGINSFSVTDCFSDKYDVYYVSVTKVDIAQAYYNRVRLINASGIDTGSNYDYAALQLTSYQNFSQVRSTTATFWLYSSWQSANASDGQGLGMYIFNPYDSSSYTFMTHQASGFNSGSGMLGFKGIGVHHTAEQITGIEFNTPTSAYNYDNITVNIFGVK